jgi:hypothetical protein
MTTSWTRKATAAVLMAVMMAAGAGTALAQNRQWARVEAYSTAAWTVWGYKGQAITVRVNGDGDTDLDLYVFDDNGRLIVFDEDPDDFPVVTFTVLRSSRFTVEVRNLGHVYNRYSISTTIR